MAAIQTGVGSIRQFSVGETTTLVRTVTEADVLAFANLSGDRNPVHLDDAYAKRTRFEKRIVHGLFVGALISAAIGMDLPGEGTIYSGQTLSFLAPVFIGDTLTVTVSVKSVEGKGKYTLDTVVTNQHGNRVVEGVATVAYRPVI